MKFLDYNLSRKCFADTCSKIVHNTFRPHKNAIRRHWLMLDFNLQNLLKLDLSYISYLGPNLLVKLVSKLPRIKSINFRMTPVTDQVQFFLLFTSIQST